MEVEFANPLFDVLDHALDLGNVVVRGPETAGNESGDEEVSVLL
jgi:hypothetical protein